MNEHWEIDPFTGEEYTTFVLEGVGTFVGSEFLGWVRQLPSGKYLICAREGDIPEMSLSGAITFLVKRRQERK